MASERNSTGYEKVMVALAAIFFLYLFLKIIFF